MRHHKKWFVHTTRNTVHTIFKNNIERFIYLCSDNGYKPYILKQLKTKKMGSQNFEAFKPLSEEEEKHVVGGGAPNNPNGNPQCAPIQQEMIAVQGQISAFSSQGVPVPASLLQTEAELQLKYQQCVNQSNPN
jgi:hypothetical protein